MYELFYIIETQEGWYQLCVKGTHYVLSSGSDLDKILMTLKGLVKKYRTKERLMRALSKTEDKGQVNEKTMTVYQDLYEELSHHYDHLVNRTVKEGLEEAKQDSTFNKVKKRLKVMTTYKEDILPAPKKEEEVLTVKRPKVLKKRKCLTVCFDSLYTEIRTVFMLSVFFIS